mgnify:CR=1 FL=1
MNDRIEEFTNWLVPPDPKGLRGFARTWIGIFSGMFLCWSLFIGILTILDMIIP